MSKKDSTIAMTDTIMGGRRSRHSSHCPKKHGSRHHRNRTYRHKKHGRSRKKKSKGLFGFLFS